MAPRSAPQAAARACRPAATVRSVARRFDPGDFPPPVGPRLRAALAREHARAPFGPRDVRDAARRVARVAASFDLAAVLVRGGLDVGGAEVDHVWAVVDERVVDVAFPLRSDPFVAALRAYIAGDVDGEVLDRTAHAYAIDWRVVGVFPPGCRYLGAPFWTA